MAIAGISLGRPPGRHETFERVLKTAELAAHVASFVTSDGIQKTILPQLSFRRLGAHRPIETEDMGPSLSLLIQGSQRLVTGPRALARRPGNYFINVIAMPVARRTLDSGGDESAIELLLSLEMDHLRELVLEIPQRLLGPSRLGRRAHRATASSTLLDALMRLVALAQSRQDALVLWPTIRTEIYYRILTDVYGRQLARASLHSHRNGHATQTSAWIRQNYREPLVLAELAGKTGLSNELLCRTFADETLMTPLQFQTTMRIHEAHRLIRAGISPPEAGRQVGYASPQAFMHAYLEMFPLA